MRRDDPAEPLNVRIAELVGKGMSDAAIARETGHCRSTVFKRREALGLPSGIRKITDQEIMRLYEAGHSDRVIGEYLGISAKAVGQRRRQIGLIRDRTAPKEAARVEVVPSKVKMRPAPPLPEPVTYVRDGDERFAKCKKMSDVLALAASLGIPAVRAQQAWHRVRAK